MSPLLEVKLPSSWAGSDATLHLEAVSIYSRQNFRMGAVTANCWKAAHPPPASPNIANRDAVCITACLGKKYCGFTPVLGLVVFLGLDLPLVNPAFPSCSRTAGFCLEQSHC